MKIYFGMTVAGDRSGLEAARRAVGFLESRGHEVLTRHLVEDGARAADRELGPEAVYARDMAWIEACELFIAEVSGSSFGVGYEAGYLLGGRRTPVVLLHRRQVEARISLLITGNRHPNCTVVAYDSAEEMEAALVAAGV